MSRVRDFVPEPRVPETDTQVYGIEVELENVIREPNPGPASGWLWALASDGSLRGSGLEFLTPGAWDLETCEAQCRLLWEQIEARRWRSSIRTGIHVHVNCLDYTLEQVGGILMTYCLLEPVLFRLCGPQREQNIYCVPWYRAGTEEHIAQEYIGGQVRSATNACKYSALYLQPLLRFGTIEFRHAPTFDTAEEMLDWLRTIAALVAYGRQYTAQQVWNEAQELGPDAWAKWVFGDHFEVVSEACESSIEEIMDEVDSGAVAEGLLDFNGVDAWVAPALYVQGNGTSAYHRGAQRAQGIPVSMDPFLASDEEDEYYDDEEVY